MTLLRSSPIVVFLVGISAIGPASSGTSAFQQAPPRPGVAPPVRDAAPRPAATGTGSISGVVVSTDTQPRPVRRARVSIFQTEQGALIRLIAPTDDAGRFVFNQLPPGRYSVSANLPGWVAGSFGGRTPGGQGMTLALTDGQRIENVTIAMTRGAVITGRVVDMTGQPVVGSRVLVSERRTVNGVTSFQSGLIGLGSQTDDRGMYRAFGLRAGSYVVSVSPQLGQTGGGRMVTAAELQWVTSAPAPGSSPAPPPPPGPMSIFAQVFHPGTTDANAASVVTLGAGEEREGIDISLQLIRTVKVSGAVTRPDGQRAVGAQVLVAPVDQPLVDPFSMLIRNSGSRGVTNGEFSFTDLQPGRYSISARAASVTGAAPAPAPPVTGPSGRGAAAPPPPPLDLWASAEITVAGEDIEGLSLTLQPGMTVSGRVVFEGATPPPDPSRVQLRLMPPPTGTMTITTSQSLNMVAADGSFSMKGLAPGPYDVSAFAPGATPSGPTWMLKSAVSGGRSLLDSPIDIRPGDDLSDVVVTFTDKVTEVTGLLLDQAGRPAPEFYVIVFPTNATLWTQRSRWLRVPTRPASDGRYRISGLPPGEFYLAALTEFDPNDWSSPTFLEQVVPGAIKVTIGEGEKKTQDVRLGI